MRQLFIGLCAEGNTDVRFLKTVIANVLQEISWECSTQVDIADVRTVNGEGQSFVEKMLDASNKAEEIYGISILCVHADSDHRTIDVVKKNKFDPFLSRLETLPDARYCKFIVPTIPIQMVEAWMLADKILLKQLINASQIRDVDLGIERDPESYSDPKEAIQNAIRVAMQGRPKKMRDQIDISDLYETLGNRLGLEKLRQIPSFLFFEGQIRRVLQKMGLLR